LPSPTTIGGAAHQSTAFDKYIACVKVVNILITISLLNDRSPLSVKGRKSWLKLKVLSDVP
jgi:hypothetical protein